MPYGSGRTDVAGNIAGKTNTGRSGTPGNVDGLSPRLNYRKSASASGHSGAPGNSDSLRLPSRAAGSMQSRTGKPSTSGVPRRSTGKFNYQRSSGLLQRKG